MAIALRPFGKHFVASCRMAQEVLTMRCPFQWLKENFDGDAIIDIFNHYVKHSFAAFPESRLPCEAITHFPDMTGGYPFVAPKDAADKVVGFALLRAHHPMPTFALTAETTCFISS